MGQRKKMDDKGNGCVLDAGLVSVRTGDMLVPATSVSLRIVDAAIEEGRFYYPTGRLLGDGNNPSGALTLTLEDIRGGLVLLPSIGG